VCSVSSDDDSEDENVIIINKKSSPVEPVPRFSQGELNRIQKKHTE
jgi:hypothetical protein